MKQALKNEVDILNLMNTLQAQLTALDKKVDTLINRSVPNARPAPNPAPRVEGRMKYTAICADCNKECTIPFKPSGDRPVYCQDCFSRRKVIKLSGIHVAESPQMNIQETQASKKKKSVTIKKTTTKKKLVPKKK